MLTSIFATLLMSFLPFGPQSNEKAATPQPGVPIELAQHRASHYHKVQYLLTLNLTPNSEKLTGTAEILLTLDKDVPELVLDWRPQTFADQSQARVWNIEVNDQPVSDARFENEHLIIPKTYLESGINRVSLKFESAVKRSGSAVTRYVDQQDKSEYIYTLFVPSDASTLFPCFDQPDLKARFILELTVPEDWNVVSNTDVAWSNVETESNRLRVRFHKTEPISTYLFAFAAGPFEILQDSKVKDPTRLFVRKSKMARARQDADEVLRLNREAVAYFEGYFKYRFPFSKYDLVLIPEFPYGGMEHAGATFLRENAILFLSTPSGNDLVGRAQLIFHETAHQWFGDLVTMKWFDDLWLKEGFANFMAAKATEKILPQYNAWNAFHAAKTNAYRTDITPGTTPIYQVIPNLSAAKSAYGNIVYNKAPSVLRQAEFYLGAKVFQTAVQQFVKQHAFANAEWKDLVNSFEQASKRELDTWADAWVKRRGLANIRAGWELDQHQRIRNFTLTQENALGEAGVWPMRLQILAHWRDDQTKTFPVVLDGPKTVVSELNGLPEPLFVYANAGDYGYGRFLLDLHSRKSLLTEFQHVEDPFLRSLLWGALWDAVLDADLAPRDYLNLVLANLPIEQDEVTISALLGRTFTLCEKYLSPAQRQQMAEPVEKMLTEGMLNRSHKGTRILFFRAFTWLALSPSAQAKLIDLLNEKVSIPEIKLSSSDRFDIVARLIQRKHPDAATWFARQSQLDITDDGRRAAFAVKAVTPTVENKQQYFEAYFKDQSLPESWIEDSLSFFNVPDQAEITQSFLKMALTEIPHLKKKRKIFFINRWLGAFIGGQTSESALTVVETFLAETQLEPDLRLKVLEFRDGLERCVKIREKYARTE